MEGLEVAIYIFWSTLFHSFCWPCYHLYQFKRYNMYPFKIVTIHLRPTMGSPFGFRVCNPEALVGVDSTDRKSCDAGVWRSTTVSVCHPSQPLAADRSTMTDGFLFTLFLKRMNMVKKWFWFFVGNIHFGVPWTHFIKSLYARISVPAEAYTPLNLFV